MYEVKKLYEYISFMIKFILDIVFFRRKTKFQNKLFYKCFVLKIDITLSFGDALFNNA